MFGLSGKIANAEKIDLTRWYEPDTLPGYSTNVTPYAIGGQGSLLTIAGQKIETGCYSLDGGITWVDATGLLDMGNEAGGVAYNPANGVFLIVGVESGGASTILKNADLTGSWTTLDDPVNTTLLDAEFGSGTWVVVGNDDGSNATILISTDADPTTFTNKTFTDYYGLTYDAVSVAHAPNAATNQWCVALNRSIAQFVYSDDDGATWTNPFQASSGVGSCLGASDDTFIAGDVGSGSIWRNVGGTAGGFSDVSPSLGFSFSLNDIAYGAGYWVAVGGVESSYPVVIVSGDNGSTWSRVGSAAQLGSRPALSVHYNGSRFIIGMSSISSDLIIRFTR